MAVTLTVTIPTEHQSRVLDAIAEYADKTIQMTIRVIDVDKWEWTFPEQGTDTPTEWGEKILQKFLVNLVKCYEFNLDLDRYNAEINTIDLPAENVPEDIVE